MSVLRRFFGGQQMVKPTPPYKILVLVDGSVHSDAAFDAAVALKKPDHVIQLVHSVNLVRPWTAGPHAGPYLDPQTLAKTNDALIHNAKHMLHKYTRWASQLKIPNVQAFVLTSDENPKDAALHFAREQDVRLIVVGSRGLGGIQRFLVGSFSSHIVQNAQCDVLVARVAQHKSRDPKADVGLATRAELNKIITAEQRAEKGPGPSGTSTVGPEGAAERYNRLRKQLEDKQKELRVLMDELATDENEREVALRAAVNENAEMLKRREAEAANSARQLQNLQQARDSLLEQIKEKEKETQKLRADKEAAINDLKQKQTETELRTREKEEAMREVRKRVEYAETQRVQLADMLKRTEELAERDRAKRENELKQLQAQAAAQQSESENDRAVRDKVIRDKEAEVMRERVEHEKARTELQTEIVSRQKQIEAEQAREKQLQADIDAARRHTKDLEAEVQGLHSEIDSEKKAHNADVERLSKESAAKQESIRAELQSQLEREQARLQEVIAAKDSELTAERAKRKEAELQRARDEEARIGEKASASRMLRQEMERSEAEAEQRLAEQREIARQKAKEMREAESEAARSAPTHDPTERRHASTHRHSETEHTYGSQTAQGQRVVVEHPEHSRVVDDESNASGFVPAPADKRCHLM